ncbi:ribosomal protein L37AE/L43A [Silvibacterium bohemicum]|uniref:Ribosomal protein L37AE/L43A n=1 Tax=Silvibacterium bohemicum TaxID=1577686 RepID=A0A841JPF1_9BACT|nr:ribosomal protein L37AE/L43A [Silvibacterium bohemicum]
MHCANPNCSSESKYFRGGSLHCIDCGEAAGEQFRGARRPLIWFCPDCAAHWAVETWRPAGQQMRCLSSPLHAGDLPISA